MLDLVELTLLRGAKSINRKIKLVKEVKKVCRGFKELCDGGKK